MEAYYYYLKVGLFAFLAIILLIGAVWMIWEVLTNSTAFAGWLGRFSRKRQNEKQTGKDEADLTQSILPRIVLSRPGYTATPPKKAQRVPYKMPVRRSSFQRKTVVRNGKR